MGHLTGFRLPERTCNLGPADRRWVFPQFMVEQVNVHGFGGIAQLPGHLHIGCTGSGIPRGMCPDYREQSTAHCII